jgi:hypothetical protein
LCRGSRAIIIRAMPELTSLYLAPADPSAACRLGAVTDTLRELGVITDALDGASFLAGDGFLRHVVFAGCSPHLAMRPPEDGSRAFCHVTLHGPLASPGLVTGANTFAPRCPTCRNRFADWRDAVDAWADAGSSAQCRACGAIHPPGALDWRQQAIAGRVLVEFHNVFPGEAAPSDTLLHRLADATGQAWRYAWTASLAATHPVSVAPRA